MSAFLNRRAFLARAAGVGSAALLAACTPKVPTAVPPTAAPAPKTPVSIRWSYWSNEALSKVYDQSVALFQQQNPNIKVVQLLVPGTTTEWGQKVLAMIAGNDVPDVLLQSSEHLSEWRGKGLLADLKPFIDADKLDLSAYFEAAIKGTQRAGKQLGFPIGMGAAPVFYNKTHIKEAGAESPTNPDWTWDDLVDLAKKLTRKVGNQQRYGFHVSRWFDFLIAPRVWQNGGEVFNADETKCLLDQKPAIDAVQWRFDLRNKHRVAPDAAEMKSIQELGAFYFAFMANMASMGTEGMYCPAGFNTTAGLDWDMQVFPIPRGGRRVSSTGLDAIAACARSKSPAEAWALVKFMTGKDGQLLRAVNGHWCPVVKSVANDTKAQAGLGLNKNFQAVFRELDYARPTVSIMPRYLEVKKYLNPALDLVLAGEKTAAEALTEAVKQINDMLSKPPAQ